MYAWITATKISKQADGEHAELDQRYQQDQHDDTKTA